MSYHVSTGLRNGMLVSSCLVEMLNGGFIMIYDGPVPASADDALVAANHLLVTITNGGGGITFAATAEDGGVSKTAAEAWSGEVLVSGTATFYRHIGAVESAGASGTFSTTLPRLQGAIGTYGAEMILSNAILTAGYIQRVDYYMVGLPTL